MIIQPWFTQGHDSWAFRKLAQRCDDIFFCFFYVSGMNANHRIDVGIFFGQGDRALAAFNRRADGEYSGNTRIGGAPRSIAASSRVQSKPRIRARTVSAT